MTATYINAIETERRQLLSSVEKYAEGVTRRLDSRKTKAVSFFAFKDFCSPMVMDLIAWERIRKSDLPQMPATKRLIIAAANAAKDAVLSYGHRDPMLHRGEKHRKFTDIQEAELAANILPRLDHLLSLWDVTYDEDQCVYRESSKP